MIQFGSLDAGRAQVLRVRVGIPARVVLVLVVAIALARSSPLECVHLRNSITLLLVAASIILINLAGRPIIEMLTGHSDGALLESINVCGIVLILDLVSRRRRRLVVFVLLDVSHRPIADIICQPVRIGLAAVGGGRRMVVEAASNKQPAQRVRLIALLLHFGPLILEPNLDLVLVQAQPLGQALAPLLVQVSALFVFGWEFRVGDD